MARFWKANSNRTEFFRFGGSKLAHTLNVQGKREIGIFLLAEAKSCDAFVNAPLVHGVDGQSSALHSVAGSEGGKIHVSAVKESGHISIVPQSNH